MPRKRWHYFIGLSASDTVPGVALCFTQSKGLAFPSSAASLQREDEVHVDVALSYLPGCTMYQTDKKRVLLEYAGVEVTSWERSTAGLEAFLANHRHIMLEKQSASHQHYCSRLGIDWWVQCLCNLYLTQSRETLMARNLLHFLVSCA